MTDDRCRIASSAASTSGSRRNAATSGSPSSPLSSKGLFDLWLAANRSAPTANIRIISDADSRLQAIEQLRDAARESGSNAIIAMRFDCNELGGNMTEVAAYGTAVTVQRA